MPHRDKVRSHEYQAAYQTAYRAAARMRVEAIKSVPCADCGGRFPPECMDFDHIRGKKLSSVSQMLWRSRALIAEEIAKCEVVCANCHRTRSRKRRAG